jgi:nicotinamide mononucleotide (NMN) deamidase PncC
MRDIWELGERAGALLVARGERVAVSESSSGGLVSAALLAVPGASAFYLGGGVIYTPRAIFGLSASTIPRSIRPAALAASKR